DSQGEIVRKEAIIRALPDYMKLGNIREMHQASAVGKAKEAVIDENGLLIRAKIVDKNAWQKVKEGVYNGFSIGGHVVMQKGREILDMVLTEISIVDRPSNPDTIFTLVKAADLRKAPESGIQAALGYTPWFLKPYEKSHSL